MIAKIDVRKIVFTHFASLIDGKGKKQWGDWLLFLGIPVACSLLMIVKKSIWVLNNDSLTVLVKLRRTLLSENFHTPMGSSHCWLYAAV